MTTTTSPFTKPLTCQICGGTYAALEGYIARHGHKRIKGQRGGKGFMTDGCMGSRELPYEHSRDVLPHAIEAQQKRLDRTRADLADLMNPAFEAEARDEGYDHYGYRINETDLDRRGIDDGEEANEILEDMTRAMGELGFSDFKYGTITWEQFWAKLTLARKAMIRHLEASIKVLQERFDKWEQTISDEEWDANREIIVHEKRVQATKESWKTRRGEERDYDDMARVRDPHIAVLHQFGQDVAKFIEQDDDWTVVECTLVDGEWTPVDTHESWEVIEKTYGADLIFV